MEKVWVKSYEPGVPPSIDYPDLPLHQILFQTARRFPNHPAIDYYGRRISYAELESLIHQFGNALIELGVMRGDRVAIMLPNLPQCIIAYYGALYAGAIVVPTNPLYVERELEFQLNDSGAVVLVALDLFYPRIQAVLPKTGLKRVILTGAGDYLPFFKRMLYPLKAMAEGNRISVTFTPPLYQFCRLLGAKETAQPVVPVASGDTALLQYTGGTTGTPKGVMLTHANLIANTVQCRHWMPTLREGAEVFMGVVPYFHVYGMTTCMNLAIFTGGNQVLLPRFKTDEVLNAIRKNRATLFMGVQAMYVAINHHPKVESIDLSSIRICISGAGPLHQEVQDRFESLTGGKLVEGYGLTEAAPVTHCSPIAGRRRKGTIGLPFPDTDARIVDVADGSKELPTGQAGELIVKGPQVMQGYWNRPDETAGVLKDGWLYTGDVATMDADGYFAIVDRKKDMIKTRGENVYPREVEEAIFRNAKVKEAVVVGVPDEFSVEAIKAFIVLKEGETATEPEMIEFLSKELARFKVPKAVEFRSELPKTMVGKVLRRVLLSEELSKKKGRGGHE